VPRKPTSYARSAEKEIRRLAELGDGTDQPLPTVRELGKAYDVSYATISRILQRLSQEAVVWQHPNGRFYPVSSRLRIAQSFPIILIGRQMQNWSALYREILEGVSEVCAARGCPLVFLSSAKLVEHSSPENPPAFIALEEQRSELERLLASVPRPCGGVLLDHLWQDELVQGVAESFRQTSLLLRTCPGLSALGSLDLAAGAEIMLNHLSEHGYQRLIVADPFSGDQAVQATWDALSAKVRERGLAPLETADGTTPESRAKLAQELKLHPERTAVISLEDNVTALLWREFQQAKIACPEKVGLVSLQGTSAVGSSITRLRYDYRLLGRELVSLLLESKADWRPLRPTLIRGRTAL
jgi:DNA-binding LacI/PurR family transcriptional regulator